MRCQHYQSAIITVQLTVLLLTMPASLAGQLSRQGLVLKPFPGELPGLEMHLYWHRDQSADPAHSWLRQRVLAQLKTMQNEIQLSAPSL